MGFTKGSSTWVLVACVCMNAAYTNAWGTYFCDLQEQGLQRIGEICSESATSMESPFSALEEKLDRVLDFMEDIKTTEDSWLHTTKKSGTVERDLSQHEESNLEEKGNLGHNETDEDREGDDEGTVDTRDREQTRQETRTEDRTYGGDSRDKTSGYDSEKRGDRTYKYDWRNRRDYTSRDEGERRRERTDEGDREGTRNRASRDETRRHRIDIEDTRENIDESEEDTEPKKGECSALVMDSHETIGMFYMMSYQHGHCSNRNPIGQPIRYCLGYCTTKTFIERESGIWTQGNDCNSCQPLTFETLRIPLSCDDGFTFEKKFKNVVECSCRRCKPVDTSRG